MMLITCQREESMKPYIQIKLQTGTGLQSTRAPPATVALNSGSNLDLVTPKTIKEEDTLPYHYMLNACIPNWSHLSYTKL